MAPTNAETVNFCTNCGAHLLWQRQEAQRKVGKAAFVVQIGELASWSVEPGRELETSVRVSNSGDLVDQYAFIIHL